MVLLFTILSIIISFLAINYMPTILYGYSYSDLNSIIADTDSEKLDNFLKSINAINKSAKETAQNIKTASIIATIIVITITFMLLYIIFKIQNQKTISPKPYHYSLNYISKDIIENKLYLNIEVKNIMNNSKTLHIEDFLIKFDNNTSNQPTGFYKNNKILNTIKISSSSIVKIYFPITQNEKLEALQIFFKGNELKLGQILKFKNGEII